MLHKTRGLVFRFTRYRETSVIVTIFTEIFGVQSYIVNGVRSSKSSGNKMALLQPLTLLDLVVYHREHANINRIKEVKCLYPYHSLTVDVKKVTVAMFLNEIMNKTIKEESHAGELFEFLYQSLVIFDQMKHGYENFHLVFLLKLSRFLGFGPDRIEAVQGQVLLNEPDIHILTRLLHSDYAAELPVTGAQRRSLLDIVLRFYASHIDTFGEVKSVQVLREVLT